MKLIKLENEVATENTKQPSVEVFTKGRFLSLLASCKPDF